MKDLSIATLLSGDFILSDNMLTTFTISLNVSATVGSVILVKSFVNQSPRILNFFGGVPDHFQMRQIYSFSVSFAYHNLVSVLIFSQIHPVL